MYSHMTSNQEDSAEPPSPVPVLVIYSVVEKQGRGEARDAVTDEETLYTANSIAKGLRATGHHVTLAAIRNEQDLLAALAGADPHTTLVFNLCEAFGGLASNESQVPRMLERLGFQYAGATPENLDACLNKGYAKDLLLKHKVPTAAFQVFRHPDEPMRVPYPAIVKPVAEDCSMGITRDSVVRDEQSLRRQVRYVQQVYKQPALVEMFLDGREFNVGVWGNGTAHVLPVSEIDFSAWDEKTLRVVNFDAKWNPDSSEYNSMPVLCPAPVDRKLEKRIRQVALAAYKAMGCRDYARVDMREKDGTPYVLEVNPNPCLAADGGFANAARMAGYDYAQMAHQIAEWAWWRRNHHK